MVMSKRYSGACFGDMDSQDGTAATKASCTHLPQFNAICHCGQVKIFIKASTAKLESVTSCNCSLCHKYGHLCAYFSEQEVVIEGETDTYVHGDKMIAFHRCKHCGCHTHWTSIDKSSRSDRMAVNARLFPRDILAQARVRHLDGLETWNVRDLDVPYARMDIGCNILENKLHS